MKITSIKAGGERIRTKTEHEGDVKSVGFHFIDKVLHVSFYSGDRVVKLHIPVNEMEYMIHQYNRYKKEHPEIFKEEEL